jgi:hypothetical protein
VVTRPAKSAVGGIRAQANYDDSREKIFTRSGASKSLSGHLGPPFATPRNPTPLSSRKAFRKRFRYLFAKAFAQANYDLSD